MRTHVVGEPKLLGMRMPVKADSIPDPKRVLPFRVHLIIRATVLWNAQDRAKYRIVPDWIAVGVHGTNVTYSEGNSTYR